MYKLTALAISHDYFANRYAIMAQIGMNIKNHNWKLAMHVPKMYPHDTILPYDESRKTELSYYNANGDKRS